MIVFEWFYEKDDFFEQLLKVEQGYEVHIQIAIGLRICDPICENQA